MNGTGNGKVESNQSQITWIVRTLATALILCIVGTFVLLYNKIEVPNELWMLTASFGTGLAPMLSKTYATPTTLNPSEPPKPKPAGELEVPAQTLEVTP